jgi:hypothetical protein
MHLFLIREFSSKLPVEVLVGGGGGIEKKTMKTYWNKNFSSSRARLLTLSP